MIVPIEHVMVFLTYRLVGFLILFDELLARNLLHTDPSHIVIELCESLELFVIILLHP